MIKFFRKIRQRLLTDNKLSKYLLYAIGEISLVMIGILLALQVNNWNNSNKDRKLEKQYISGLIIDLEADSIAIARLKKESDEQVRRKRKLNDYFEGQSFSNDSINYYFSMQWEMAVSFTPITTTFDEMKSTGRIVVIQNPSVRNNILRTYTNYQMFINTGQAYYERQRGELRKYAFKIPGLYLGQDPKNEAQPDIKEALKDVELRNGIFYNYAFTVNEIVVALEKDNKQLLTSLRSYLSKF